MFLGVISAGWGGGFFYLRVLVIANITGQLFCNGGENLNLEFVFGGLNIFLW